MNEPKKKLPVVKIAAAAVALGLLAAVVAAAVAYGPAVRRFTLDTARERGIDLHCDVIDPGIRRVELGGCRFRLLGVEGLRATARRITVELDGLEPSSVAADEVDVQLVGSAPDLAMAVSTWARSHPRAFRAPVAAKGIDVRWSASADATPWLDIQEGTLAPIPSGAVLAADEAKVAGASVGQVGASWLTVGDTRTGSVALGFGKKDLRKAPVHIKVEHGGAPASATITLRPTRATDLALPLGVALPVEDVRLSGKAALTFETAAPRGPVAGTLSIRAKGYVPPHPPELDGIVFGDVTTFESKLHVDEGRTVVKLTDTRVRAGAFRLAGGGTLKRGKGSTTLALSLQGSVPCTEIARAAAVAHLGQVVGGMLGSAARQAVRGSVGVRVTLSADTRRLSEARIEKTIGVGCGLKPLGLPIPPIPSSLPPIPTALPLPTLPPPGGSP